MNGPKALLDTNVIIGVLKSHPEAIQLVTDCGFELRDLAASQITRMEMLSFPGLKKNEEDAINAFLKELKVINLNFEIEKEAINIRRKLGIKLPDAIIAATAKTNNAVLITLDKSLKKAFDKIGLKYSVTKVGRANGYNRNYIFINGFHGKKYTAFYGIAEFKFSENGKFLNLHTCEG